MTFAKQNPFPHGAPATPRASLDDVLAAQLAACDQAACAGVSWSPTPTTTDRTPCAAAHGEEDVNRAAQAAIDAVRAVGGEAV